MTTVEAMSAGVVPVVIGLAGQRETVRHGVDGYHFQKLSDLAALTRCLVEDGALRAQMSLSAEARAREFSLLQYNAPPTTEDLGNDTQFENFNTCVTGGRIRGEAHLTRSDSARAWLGRYSSWAESASNTDCEIRADYENRVWDAAVGFEHRIPGGKLDLSVGTRFDDAGRELDTPSGATHVFYREENLRYTAAVPLGGPFALELDGVHRRRRQTLGGDASGGAWFEGQHTASVEWGERLAAGVGFEYDDHATAETYFNTQWSYRPTDALVFGLFLGQRRGALRCVGGVCRVYPPFEGGRLDATLRF
jgi:hypothetical protein